MDPLTLIGLIAPLFVQGGKAFISRFIAPKEFRPSTIDEFEKMSRLDMERFAALNAAGGTNPTYEWVEAIVRLQRPFVVAVTLIVWAGVHLYVLTAHSEFISAGLQQFVNAVDNATACVAFYLFGERTMLGSATAGSSGMTPLSATQDASKPTSAPVPIAGGPGVSVATGGRR